MGTALLSALATLPGQALPRQVDRDDVIAALGVAPEPSHYVIAVDTSTSMSKAGRWESVTSSLAAFSATLLAEDRVSLISFDDTATVVLEGVTPTADQIVKALPASPDGSASDIGLGISAGLDELEAADHGRPAAFVLITDGRHHAAPGSAFASLDAEAWSQLRVRADALADRRVAAYAIALSADADSSLLARVFPAAVDVPANEVKERFGHLDVDLLDLHAKEMLAPDLIAKITNSWSREFSGLNPGSGTMVVDLTLTSTLTHVPVVRSGFAATAGGLRIGLGGLPASIELAPGESRTVPVEMTWQGTGEGRLELAAVVGSPWQQVITGEFGLTFAPALSGSVPIATRVPLDLGWLPGWIGAGSAVLGLVAGGWFLARTSRPELRGSLSVERDGVALDEVVLSGRRLRLSSGGDLDAVVTGARRRGSGRPHTTGAGQSEPGVRLVAHTPAGKVRAILFDGDDAQVGALTVRYTTVRSRMIALIES